jgi:transposase-like protein
MSEKMAAHPVGGVDYPQTFQQLLAWFPDDAACLDYLAGLRWPDGFVCPACGSGRYWRTATARWMCADCGRQTSVTAGTIFHRTRTPLSTWFAAVWFITSQKNGVSALGLQRVLGFGSYETAWAWMHKLRRTMVRPDRDQLSGVVELDEVFIGNETRGKAGGAKDNTAAMVAVESLPGRKLGRVRMEVSPLAGSFALVDFAQRTIAPGSTIRTDGARTLRVLSDLGYQHEYFVGLNSTQPRPRPPSGRPPGRLATQTLADRHPALRRLPGAPGLLPGRVHLPLQPPNLQGPRPAVLPATPTSSRHRPDPPQRPARAPTRP